MKYYEYSYRSGMSIIPDYIVSDIVNIISNINLPIERNGVSKINKAIMSGLYNKGWSNEIPLGIKSKMSITSQYKTTGLCLQTGNVSRTYADLLKLQALFIKGVISSGIIIVPEYSASRILGSNMANMKRLERDLDVFLQVITIPIIIIGFSN